VTLALLIETQENPDQVTNSTNLDAAMLRIHRGNRCDKKTELRWWQKPQDIFQRKFDNPGLLSSEEEKKSRAVCKNGNGKSTGKDGSHDGPHTTPEIAPGR